jgi:uncharacterized protein (TIGR03790 family)
MTDSSCAIHTCIRTLLRHHLACLLLVIPWQISAQDEWNPASETLVVFNPDFPGSEALAKHYATARQIPAERLIGLPCPNTDDISRSDFNTQIRGPLRKQFEKNKWWQTGNKQAINDTLTTRVKSSQIRIIALIRGIPFRILRETPNPPAGKEDEASVDSELALLGMEPYSLPAFTPNPFFKSELPFHLNDSSPGLLLISRLDGPNNATVKRMIDDAIKVENEGLTGRAVIDLALKDGAYEQGEEWLRQCATLYRKNGIPLYVDRYRDCVSGVFEDPSFRFAPGAVVCHLHSFSAARLRSGTEHWTGPLLLRGAVATLGNVWEPYLAVTCYFDLFNQRLLSGATLAESAWFASPGLSWMQVVLGDPLYRPFKKPPGSRLGTEGRSRDYALYHGLVTTYPNDSDAPKLKSKLLQLADKRQSPHLIELLGLLSGQTGDSLESADVLDHAASLYPAHSPDQQRARLYQAEALRTHRDFKAAIEALKSIPEHPATAPLLEKLK